MATLAARGSGTPVTSGTTWAALTNAVDGTAGTNPATYTTYTNATASAVGYIEISGYDFASSIGASDTLNSVTVNLRHFENNTGRFVSVRFQPYDGATAIGTIFTATLATGARNDSTTFPVTLAQLRSATFKIRVTITGAASTQSRVESIDYVDVTADYTPLPPAITQAAYRFYADGTETGATALAAQDTGYTADTSGGDVNLQLRVRLQSTNAVAVAATDDFQMQWEKNTSGTWTNVSSGGGAPLLLDSYAFSNQSSEDPMYTVGSSAVAQSFQGNGQAVATCSFWVRKVGTAPNGILTAALWTHTGTYGTGGLLGTLVATSLNSTTSTSLTTSFAKIDFNFGPTYQVVSSTPYFIGLEYSGTDGFAERTAVAYDTSTSTHPGNEARRAAGSGSLTATTFDLIFEVSTVPLATTVLPYASADLTDAAATTNRLGAGSGSFVAGKISEDGLVDDVGWTANNYTELLYSITLKQADLAPTDTLRFRVLRNGATTGLTYTQVPTVTIGAGGPTDRTGTATGSVTLGGTASGQKDVTATAVGTLTVTGTASGVITHDLTGTATGAMTLTGTAAGSVAAAPVLGTAAGTLTLTGTSAGVRGTPGSATGSLTLGGTASAQKTVTSTAAGTLTFAGTGVGVRGRPGVATGTVTLTGTAAGVKQASGVAVGTITLTGTAAGAKTVTGAATGGLTLTGVAAGLRVAGGTATGTLTLGGTAAGQKTVAGVASSSLTITGTGAATRQVTGTGTGQIVFTSTALGLVEGNAVGTATGNVTLGGTAVGRRSTTGTAAGSLTLGGTATGTRAVRATAAATLTVVGLATGIKTVRGVAAGQIAITGLAVGTKTVQGVTTGTIIISGLAAGTGSAVAFEIVGEWNDETVDALQWGPDPVVEWFMLVPSAVTGTGTGTLTLSAVAAGTAGALGVAVGALTLSAIATGVGETPVTTSFPVIATFNTEVGTPLGAANPMPSPSGVTAGDLLLANVSNDRGNIVLSTSTGWTQVAQVLLTTAIHRWACFARIADGGANDTLSVTGDNRGYCVSILRITGHGVSSIASDIKVASTSAAIGTPANPPSLDAGSSKKWLWIAAYILDGAGASFGTAPADYTLVHAALAGGTQSELAVTSRTIETQTQDPGTFTQGANPAWIAATIAIPPAP